MELNKNCSFFLLSKLRVHLTQILSMRFVEDNPNEPYSPFMQLNTGRTLVVTDFTERNLDLIEELVGKCNIPFINARLAGVIWLRRRKPKFAKIAINNFISHTKKLLNNQGIEKQFHGESSFERACQIWKQIGNKRKYFNKSLTEFFKDIANPNLNKSKEFLRIRLLKISVKYNLIDNPKEWMNKFELLKDIKT